MKPEVSVLMSVYNGEHYISEAIQSILSQTFKNFEFIIIDDASEDSTAKLISGYNDQRIRYFKNSYNQGLTASLNKGILLSKGEYIARMDADDISLPVRLFRQVNYLNENYDVGLLGTWYKEIPSGLIVKFPSTHAGIYAQLFKNNAIAHPAAMLRRDVLIDNQLVYDSEFKNAQDYELWSRLIEKTRVANIPEVLLFYRLHQHQISSFKNTEQLEYDTKVKIRLYNRLVINNNIHFLEGLTKLNHLKSGITTKELTSIIRTFNEAYIETRMTSFIDSSLFLKLHVTLIKRAISLGVINPLKTLYTLIRTKLFREASHREKAALLFRIFMRKNKHS